MTETNILTLYGPSGPLFLLLSACIAVLATYVLFDLAELLPSIHKVAQLTWLGCSSIALGLGYFAVQQAVMLSRNATILRRGDGGTVLALLLSTAGMGLALWVSSGRSSSDARIAIAGSGFAVALISVLLIMMGTIDRIIYAGRSFWMLLFAIILTGAISLLSIKAAFFVRQRPGNRGWIKSGAAIVLGITISAINFVGCAATDSMPMGANAVRSQDSIWTPVVHSNVLSVFALLLLLFLRIAVKLDRRASLQLLDIQQGKERYRVLETLNEQRVTTLQNEALLEEIQERKKIEAKLSYAAFHDSLTELRNRAYLADTLTGILQSSRNRSHLCAALLYIDLDKFKVVNDMLGHRAGDLLLIEIAKRLKECARAQDTLARMGGDEFTLLLDNLRNIDQAFQIAQRILSVIEEPISLAGAILPMTASIGLCAVNLDYGEAEDVLRDADTAMYYAKRAGGARCLIYKNAMHEETQAALHAKLELKAAIENNEFELYYQPLMDMQKKTIYGMEALIRWNHSTRGLVSPGTFIPLAEETGHILAIGSWVLRQACDDFCRIQKKVQKDLLLTLNVASRQLDEPDFLDELTKVVTAGGMPPRLLQLEITESVFLKDASRIGSIFEQVRALGIRIAFDDFGTGYSSLSYIEKYPIDTIKIDQSFVQKIAGETASADIIQLIIDLARATGMSVSAEGVEEVEQAEMLLRRGCRIAQGYLYSRPVTLDRFISLLERERDAARPLLSLP